MGLFDNFSADNTSQFIKNVQNTDGALGDGSNMDGAAYYKVYIVASTEHGGVINITADGPESFSFETSVDYDTPYKNTGEDFISGAAKKVGLGSVSELAVKVATATGTKLFTQALTAKVWSGGGVTRLSVPLIFQVEDDPEEDVLMPLMKLMYLSMPREDEVGGFLSGPGPRFDLSKVLGEAGSAATEKLLGAASSGGKDLLKAAGSVITSPFSNAKSTGGAMSNTGQAVLKAVDSVTSTANNLAAAVSNGIKNSVKNQISVQIGTSFRLESVVITSVSQVHRVSPIGYEPGVSSGINSLVKVEVVFESFYTLTQRDIKAMMQPMNTTYGSVTDKLYQKLIGAQNAK